MLFLISQITMRISREAKIVLILDSSCLSIMFAELPQFSCELHLKTKSNWVHGSKQYSYWLIKNYRSHSVVRWGKVENWNFSHIPVYSALPLRLLQVFV